VDFVAEGTQEKMDEEAQRIVSGEYILFDGVLETNTGETFDGEGKTLDDATIMGSLNWYYRNVVVEE
jgi:basic membrane protein A